MSGEPSTGFPQPAGVPPTPHKEKDKDPTPAPAGSPSEPRRAPTPPVNNVARVGAIAGAGGLFLGFLLGYAVGSPSEADKKRSAETAPDGSAQASSAPSASAGAAAAAPQGPAEVVLDFGTAEEAAKLRGPWVKGQVLQRGIAQTIGPEAQVDLQLAPVANSYGLAIVAKAERLGANESLSVVVRLNDKEVAKWQLGPEWEMYSTVLKPGVVAAGANSVDFVLPASTAEAKPALVVDSFHLAPLLSRAETTVASPGTRGNLISGFYSKEGEGPQAAAWSAGKRTRVGLLLAPLNAAYDIELQGYAFGPLQPLEVEAFVNSKSAGTQKVDKGPKYTFRAAPGVLNEGLNIVEFVYPKTVKPSAANKASDDNRDLAIRVLGVSATPVAGPAQ